MTVLHRLWKRHVSGPDSHQAYVSFPTVDSDGEGPGITAVRDRIDALERVFEGRLDVYARRSGLAVATDPVPDSRFDREAFEAALDAVAAAYEETHELARLEKRRWLDGRLVRYHVVVPVEPLFRSTEDAPTVDAAAPVQ